MIFCRCCLILTLLFTISSLPALAAGLVDTGQTQSFNNNSLLASCPARSEAFFGQDGCYQGIEHSYTKLDSNGNELACDVLSWSVVRDNVSGLYWEVKSEDDGEQDFLNPHDIDNTYNWYNANPYENNGKPGFHLENPTTEDFIEALNNDAYGGFSDWRMPTATELSLLCDHSNRAPGSNKNYFPNNRRYSFWSANSAKVFPAAAWRISFLTGEVGTSSKNDLYRVRAVRGCKLKNQMIANDDGTVSDLTTGLLWHPPTELARTWEDALYQCKVSSYSNHSDWRLPNINELQTLIDYSQSFPATSRQFFPDMRVEEFWSSTTKLENDGQNNKAWVVNFADGRLSYEEKSERNSYMLVRGGKVFKSGDLEIDEFDAAPTTGSAPLEVTFNCEATAAPYQRITAYHWDFNNDGIIDEVTKGNWVNSTYLTAGVFTATCTAYNNTNRAQRSTPITIEVAATTNQAQDYEYYLPYYRSDLEHDLWTGIGLANADSNTNNYIKIELIGEDGQPLNGTLNLTLMGHEQRALPLGTEVVDTGWIKVKASSPLTGLAFVGGESMADIPFVEKLSTSLIIPHIAQSEIWDTKILICNPHNTENQVLIGNYYLEQPRQGISEGFVLQQTPRTLPAMGSAVYSLSQIFAGSDPVSGMVLLTAEKGVAAFALYENSKSGGHYYAGINAVKLYNNPNSR